MLKRHSWNVLLLGSVIAFCSISTGCGNQNKVQTKIIIDDSTEAKSQDDWYVNRLISYDNGDVVKLGAIENGNWEFIPSEDNEKRFDVWYKGNSFATAMLFDRSNASEEINRFLDFLDKNAINVMYSDLYDSPIVSYGLYCSIDNSSGGNESVVFVPLYYSDGMLSEYLLFVDKRTISEFVQGEGDEMPHPVENTMLTKALAEELFNSLMFKIEKDANERIYTDMKDSPISSVLGKVSSMEEESKGLCISGWTNNDKRAKQLPEGEYKVEFKVPYTHVTFGLSDENVGTAQVDAYLRKIDDDHRKLHMDFSPDNRSAVMGFTTEDEDDTYFIVVTGDPVMVYTDFYADFLVKEGNDYVSRNEHNHDHEHEAATAVVE